MNKFEYTVHEGTPLDTKKIRKAKLQILPIKAYFILDMLTPIGSNSCSTH